MSPVTPIRRSIAVTTVWLLCLFAPISHADTYTLTIQPIMPKAETETFYRPLTAYLSEQTGHEFRIQAHHNFVAYWEAVRQKSADLVLDPPHFTGYRVDQANYRVLAKIRDTLSFSLVTNEDLLLFEPAELIGKKVVTPSSPSLSGVELARMFPHQMRQPIIVSEPNFEEALQRLRAGRAEAALLPTPMISGDTTVNTVTTTEPVPHLAVSASPDLPEEVSRQVQSALLNAHESEAGQAMLEKVNISGFEPADNDLYRPYAALLQGIWGY
ncbi:phosphate/phosphite/phosphonate ABC transporter substrate-binding protein [Thiohalophilus thiocyanatoxydans]|uniref:ABC-type phosphate/phosphonate transport system substrate-binding protein n=1 Tax=Thiohalophilus thiocyanatoxydans TaxID=381308 RepID=A0A4R8IU62_9GAMM|nr:PhnD/SsuA/transferrin family substrate-binding protein [Thiohalophilus thiocyanatoxydans]TDY04188.1 ABC-type phosphate/phosphonate transport system substrate-binding protein [Thiohalophilus thiocyanatoxydans]